MRLHEYSVFARFRYNDLKVGISSGNQALKRCAFVESNRAIAVSSVDVFIRLGPAFKVEDWYVRSGGRPHLLSMMRMVRTRQTASVQLLRTPWTLRRKRKI